MSAMSPARPSLSKAWFPLRNGTGTSSRRSARSFTKGSSHSRLLPPIVCLPPLREASRRSSGEPVALFRHTYLAATLSRGSPFLLHGSSATDESGSFFGCELTYLSVHGERHELVEAAA